MSDSEDDEDKLNRIISESDKHKILQSIFNLKKKVANKKPRALGEKHDQKHDKSIILSRTNNFVSAVFMKNRTFMVGGKVSFRIYLNPWALKLNEHNKSVHSLHGWIMGWVLKWVSFVFPNYWDSYDLMSPDPAGQKVTLAIG